MSGRCRPINAIAILTCLVASFMIGIPSATADAGGLDLPSELTGRYRRTSPPHTTTSRQSPFSRTARSWPRATPVEQSTGSLGTTQNGTLDTSFGTSGTLTWPMGSGARLLDVAMQSDGKIIVASDADNYSGTTVKFGIARFS